MLALMAAGYALRPLGQAWLTRLHPDLRGAALLVALGAVLTSIGLPRQILAFTAGSVFGAGAGFVWAMLGSLAGAALGFLLAATIAGDWARRRLTGRWRQLDEFVLGQPFTAVLTLRLLPVGSNTAVNLLAGAAGVNLPAFLAGSAAGYVPQTVIFVLLGSGVQVGRPAQIAVAAALFVASSALGLVMWRHRRRAG